MAQLARIAQLAWASSAGELAQEIGKVAQLARASSALWNMVAELAQLPSSATFTHGSSATSTQWPENSHDPQNSSFEVLSQARQHPELLRSVLYTVKHCSQVASRDNGPPTNKGLHLSLSRPQWYFNTITQILIYFRTSWYCNTKNIRLH